MVMDIATVAVFDAESVTVMPTLVGPPAVVGLPLITPAAERFNPAGRFEPVASDQV
jgi:hypothetical protein